MSGQVDDRELVERYLVGNRDAAEQIGSHIEYAYRPWAGRFGFEADDIRSDITYKLLISFQRGDFNFRAGLRTYINRVVNHTCIDYWRFNRRVRTEDVDQLDLASRDLSPEQKLEKQQAARLLFRILRAVPRECIRLWRMHLKGGLTCQQIGQSLGKSGGNIRRRLWACREAAKKIRSKLLAAGKQF